MNLPKALTEKLRAWLKQAPAQWAQLSPPQRFLAVVGAVALIVGILFALSTLTRNGDDWEPATLYANLDAAEAAQIATRLNALGIRHRLLGDTGTIVVPKDQVRNLRLQLAGEGFPKTSRIGYEVFDKATLPMAELLQKVNFRRALQGELEKTLMEIEGIRNVRVLLDIPEPSPYAEEEKPLTASVNLSLALDFALGSRQIAVITHLVSASVEGLDEKDVVIFDTKGSRLYRQGEEPVEALSGRDEQLYLQFRVEKLLEDEAQGMLDRILGRNHSILRVNVALESSPEAQHDEGRPYPIHSGVQRLIRDRVVLRRISMTANIDEVQVAVDPQTGALVEKLRPQAEVGMLAELLKHAVGFQEERGDQFTLVTMPFDQTQELAARQQEEAEEAKEFWTEVAITVAKVLGILAALIVLRFIIRAIGRGVGAEEQLGVGSEVGQEVKEEDIEEDFRKLRLLDEYGKELQTARQMQMRLLPGENPQLAGFDVAGQCVSANHVSGDFYQFFRLDDHRWLVCLADVTGHGMEAAIPVVMFAGVLKSQIENCGAVDQLLANLNQTMHGGLTGDRLTGRTFVCFAGGEIDVQGKTMRVSDSGCPFPYYYQASTQEVVELELEGYPLGVRPSSAYKSIVLALGVGDRVVFCTDGLIEAADREGNMYGFERTAYAIREGCRKDLSAAGLIDYLIKEVESFTGNAPQQDDRTIVVVGVEG